MYPLVPHSTAFFLRSLSAAARPAAASAAEVDTPSDLAFRAGLAVPGAVANLVVVAPVRAALRRLLA